MSENMQAGPALDALIAEKIMGWTRIPRGTHAGLRDEAWTNDDGDSAVFELPPYSINIADAWLVVEKLLDKFAAIDVTRYKTYADCEIMEDDKDYGGLRPAASVEAETVPLVICLAALRSVQP